MPVQRLPAIRLAKKKTIEFLKLNLRKTYLIERVIKKLHEIQLFINYNLFRILSYSKCHQTMSVFINKIILFKAVSRLFLKFISIRVKLKKLPFVSDESLNDYKSRSYITYFFSI